MIQLLFNDKQQIRQLAADVLANLDQETTKKLMHSHRDLIATVAPQLVTDALQSRYYTGAGKFLLDLEKETILSEGLGSLVHAANVLGQKHCAIVDGLASKNEADRKCAITVLKETTEFYSDAERAKFIPGVVDNIREGVPESVDVLRMIAGRAVRFTLDETGSLKESAKVGLELARLIDKYIELLAISQQLWQKRLHQYPLQSSQSQQS